jgi:hypothetical protein
VRPALFPGVLPGLPAPAARQGRYRRTPAPLALATLLKGPANHLGILVSCRSAKVETQYHRDACGQELWDFDTIVVYDLVNYDKYRCECHQDSDQSRDYVYGRYS